MGFWSHVEFDVYQSCISCDNAFESQVCPVEIVDHNGFDTIIAD